MAVVSKSAAVESKSAAVESKSAAVVTFSQSNQQQQQSKAQMMRIGGEARGEDRPFMLSDMIGHCRSETRETIGGI